MDLRVSAKDLIPNHLTMALYNHTEVRWCVCMYGLRRLACVIG